MSRREQLIQKELKRLMHVPPGRSQQEHRKYLERLITWHPHGQDSSTPLSPKPPLTMKTLRMLALIRVVDKLISPTKSTRATVKPPALLPLAAAQASEQSATEFLGTHGISRAAGGNFPDKQSRERERWMRLTKMTIIPIAVAAVAGFVGGYNLRALKQPVGVALPRSPEIRRAIPVEPEIRKAIPVQTRKPQVDRRSDSMAFISPGRAIARDFATRHANANPLVGKTSRSVIGRKASK